ncbi:hypothetical protein [Catellatospora sp. NPDC049609]|uniref:hypothetical protein n=1 Tax=Catellatospora sp. NPDC049609 TaxID=3155505 RepID=UPI00344A99D2
MIKNDFAELLAQVIPVFMLGAILEIRTLTKTEPKEFVSKTLQSHPGREWLVVAITTCRVMILIMSASLLPLLLAAELEALQQAAGRSLLNSDDVVSLALPAGMALVVTVPTLQVLWHAFATTAHLVGSMDLRESETKSIWTEHRVAWAFAVLAMAFFMVPAAAFVVLGVIDQLVRRWGPLFDWIAGAS